MDKKGVFLVGLGGTGGLLAPKLTKVLLGISDVDLWLIDGDNVDLGNVIRQPYQEFNIDEKKAVALSRKLKSCYELEIFEYPEYLTGEEIRNITFSQSYDKVLILGCVDNHATRIILENEHKFLKNSLYIDSANDFEDGTIYITYNSEDGIFRGDVRSDVYPYIKLAKDHPTGHCEVEIAKGNTQQFIINDTMANSIAMVVNNYFAQASKNDTETGVIRVDGFERIFVSDNKKFNK